MHLKSCYVIKEISQRVKISCKTIFTDLVRSAKDLVKKFMQRQVKEKNCMQSLGQKTGRFIGVVKIRL